jgi:ABC-type Na+ efflux pump permease subunit
MNWRIVRAIAAKDLKEVRKNRIAVMATLILSLIFSIAMPLGVIALPSFSSAGDLAEIEQLIELLPPEVAATLAGLTDAQAGVVLMVGYLFAPLFLILPLMMASVIAAESFVGEKERKTLEALVYTPATDLELFLGKVIAALVPALIFAWINFFVYALVANIAAWPLMGRLWFPTLAWWGIMVWLVPAIALLGVSVTVIISSRVATFIEAYQISGMLVVVVVALFIGQLSGALFLSPLLLVGIGAALYAIDAALIFYGSETFTRSELIAKC